MKKLLLLISLVYIGQVNAQCPITLNGASNPSQFYDVMCNGISTSTITAGGATGYTWTPSSSLNVSTGNVVVASPTVTTIYTITATTGTCTSNSSFTVYVYNTPSAPILSGSSNPVTVCQGTPLTLSVTPGSGTSVVVWYSGSNFLYNYGATYSAATSAVGTTVYSVIDSAYYCPNSSPLTITVTVNSSPTLTVTAAPSTICSGSTTTLTASGTMTYTWSTGVNAQHIVVSPTVTTTYSVGGIGGTGCTDSKTITVTVNPAPMVTFTLVADVTPHTWDAYPTFTGGTPPYTYSWNWGDGSPNSTTAYPSHTYSVAGTYSICATITDANGCSNTYCQNDYVYRSSNNASSIVQINVLSTPMGIKNNVNINSQVNVYPNPTSDQFFIETNTTDKLNVDLYDVNGRHVFSANVMDKSNINVSTLDNGTYSLTIKTADRVINKKLVILR